MGASNIFRKASSASLAICLLCASLPAPRAGAIVPADAPLIRFAAEDWPPFITQALPAEGLSGAMLAAVFERIGYRVKVDYFPWKRTMQIGLGDPAYAGLLPVWRTAEREKLCHFSVPVGNTQSVLAYLKDDGWRFDSLSELKSVKIGTVAGYANGEQFEAMAARGELTTEEGLNDSTNLKKLLVGRFRVMVVERHVLQQLLAGRAIGKAERERVVINDTVFKERPVHVCFKRSAQGLLQQKQFNDAAREIDLARFERDYWKRLDQLLAAGAPSS